ncbi:hypothetical protein ACOI8A_27405 [Pseudomonas sp. P4795]|uniref:hypothetical protein n=1 Tax=Pseudomonas sp. P4795 TaxID=3409915 RepID=UPI003B5A1843
MADWKNIGQARWYDCKLGTMRDEDLAQLVGTKKNVIRYRRQLFDIDAWNVRMAIEPYRHLLGIESTRTVARLCGVSAYSVDQYRKSLGVKAKPGPPSLPKPKRFPVNHPLRPYKPLLGIVHDQDVADLAGVSKTTVRNWRETLGRPPAKPLPKEPATPRLKNYVGPWLGYESLFGSMSTAKISRAVGVPFAVVEQRQKFLGATPYQRVSKLVRYQHLIGLIPIGLLAKLAGVSISRASEFRNRVLAEQS